MPELIPIQRTLASSIFYQWLDMEIPRFSYQCTHCLELCSKWNSTQGLTGLEINCRPRHLNRIKAHLAVDATPKQGGIAFFTNTGMHYCIVYQPVFNELGIAINQANPTEFEMINLLIALFVFKNEILNHKTVRIIVDNNYLRSRGNKMQRHAITEAIAAILQWCDNEGCEINEIFLSNTPEDKPFFKIADRLSRNKELKQWIAANKEMSEMSWHYVASATFIPVAYTEFISDILPRLVVSINRILREPKINAYIPESAVCRRFERMMNRLHGVPDEFFEYESRRVYFFDRQPMRRVSPIVITPQLPDQSNGFWGKSFLLLTCMAAVAYFAFKSGDYAGRG